MQHACRSRFIPAFKDCGCLIINSSLELDCCEVKRRDSDDNAAANRPTSSHFNCFYLCDRKGGVL